MLARSILGSVSLALLCLSLGGAQGSLGGSLTVYAATSLTDVFSALREAFIEAHPQAEILLNFANSSTLAAQIAAGAPADVFASANELKMDAVVETGRVEAADAAIFAHNRLVIIAPARNPAGLQSPADLAKEALLLALAAEGTPIRAYTDAMLAAYDEEHGGNFRQRVLRNLVSEESNVRQVVARVALGEADAGIVYQSDALGDVADKLIAIAIDDRHNQVASYPIAPLNDARARRLAEAFVRFVLSEQAQAILEDNGFCWPAILEADPQDEPAPEPTSEAARGDDAPNIECEASALEDG